MPGPLNLFVGPPAPAAMFTHEAEANLLGRAVKALERGGGPGPGISDAQWRDLLHYLGRFVVAQERQAAAQERRAAAAEARQELDVKALAHDEARVKASRDLNRTFEHLAAGGLESEGPGGGLGLGSRPASSLG